MSAKAGRRKKAARHEQEHENEERWLVSYADMMTLLMCLFIVLFSISSVNTSKLQVLQKVLAEAFSGKVMPGGQAIMQQGDADRREQASPQPPLPAVMPNQAVAAAVQAAREQTTGTAPSTAAAQREDESFRLLKRRIDRLVHEAGLDGRVQVDIRARGLVIDMLTDRVFFDSGSATLKPQALPLLRKLGGVLRDERRHPIVVEGHTDSQPIHSARYPSNWQLSGDRAGSVILSLVHGGVPERRLSLAGDADLHPVASNATPAGRSRNRRVEIVLTRLNPTRQGGAP
jgi:chemotaxis protein MotB